MTCEPNPAPDFCHCSFSQARRAGDAGLDGGFNDPLGSTAMGGKTNALSQGNAVASSDGGPY